MAVRPRADLDGLRPPTPLAAGPAADRLSCGEVVCADSSADPRSSAGAPLRAGAGSDGAPLTGLPAAVAAAAATCLVTAVLVGGVVGWAAGALAGAAVGRVVRRREPAALRRERERASAALPVLVDLLAAALAAGAPVDRAVAAVCDAWPGAAADRLAGARARLSLGVDPVAVWEGVTRDPALAPLGRALARAAASGAPVAAAVAALADDLAEEARATVEDRARAVGVRAALPLGLCLLPAFVLVGIVPLAAGLLAGIVG
nr:type II secretion system F family protein [Nocardioides perillae]